jgi:hypothetical protein
MGISKLIKQAEEQNIISYCDSYDDSHQDILGSDGKYEYRNKDIEQLCQKASDYAESIAEQTNVEIGTFVKELFYSEDINRQSLHGVFKSLINSISNYKLETLNNLLQILILEGENKDGSIPYSVNLGINSFDKPKIKAIIFDDYLIKLFQVLDLLYSNFSNDKDIESIYYSFPITSEHKCFPGSFERLEKTFLVLNNKPHQSIQSSVEFTAGLLDKMASKYISAFQIDHDYMTQDYEIHARTALSVLTMTASIDKINESGTTFSADLIEKISFDKAIIIFKEYRSEFASFLTLNLQTLFEDIINKSDELDHSKVREIIDNYQTLNQEIYSQHNPLLPNFNDFYDEDNNQLFEKSKIIDNYKKRVKDEIEKFTQLINKIPDSAYGEEGNDNWNEWSQWIDEALQSNKDLLMHVISLISLNFLSLYINGEDNSQSEFIEKFKDKIFSKEILTKIFSDNSDNQIAQLILDHRQQASNIISLKIEALKEGELLFFDNLRNLDNLITFIDTSLIAEITHKPENIIEFFAVLNLLNKDNITIFTENEDKGCFEMFLYFCRSLSKEELSNILKEISNIDKRIDHPDFKLIQYFIESAFPSSLTLAEKKYLGFIIKNVDGSSWESIEVFRTALSYVENQENYHLLRSYIPDSSPIITIEISGQNVAETHVIEYNFNHSLIHKLPHVNFCIYPYILKKEGTDEELEYTLIELAINIGDKKFFDNIINYLFNNPDNLCSFLEISDEEEINIIKLFQTLEHKLDQKHENDESEIKASSFRTYAISQIINKLILYYNDENHRQKIIWQYEKCEIYPDSDPDYTVAPNIRDTIDSCYYDEGVSEPITTSDVSGVEEDYNPDQNLSSIAEDKSNLMLTEIDTSLSLLQIILVSECKDQIEFDKENATLQDKIAYILTSKDITQEHIEIIKEISEHSSTVLNNVLLYHINNLSFENMELFSHVVILSENCDTIKSYIEQCDPNEFNCFIKSIEEIETLTNENQYNKFLRIIFESEANKDSHEEYLDNQIIGKLINQEITKQYLDNIIKESDLTALSNFVKKINNYIHEQNSQQDYGYSGFGDSEYEESECEGKDSEEDSDKIDYNEFFGLNFLPEEDISIEFPRLGSNNSEDFNQSLDNACLKLLLQINFDKVLNSDKSDIRDNEDIKKAKYFLRNNICDAISFLQNEEDKLNKTSSDLSVTVHSQAYFGCLSIYELLDNESAKNHQINIDHQSEEINNGNNLLHILAYNNKEKELEYISEIVTEKEKFNNALLQKNEDGQTPIDILENRSSYDLAQKLRPQPAATLPDAVAAKLDRGAMSLG